jgi:co-chaperonin GroES (HSP10)
MNKKVISQREYIAAGGFICPNKECKSTNPGGILCCGSFEDQGEQGYQKNECTQCGTVWFSEWKLIGFNSDLVEIGFNQESKR